MVWQIGRDNFACRSNALFESLLVPGLQSFTAYAMAKVYHQLDLSRGDRESFTIPKDPGILPSHE
jgi:hypothetical protein